MANCAWSDAVLQLLRRMNSFYSPGRNERRQSAVSNYTTNDGLRVCVFSRRIPSCSVLQVWDRRSSGWLDSSPRSAAAVPLSRCVHPAGWWRSVSASQFGLVWEEIRGRGRRPADSATGGLPVLPERVERWGEASQQRERNGNRSGGGAGGYLSHSWKVALKVTL